MEQVKTRSKNNSKLKPLGLLNGLRKLFANDYDEIVDDDMVVVFDKNLEEVQSEEKAEYIETVAVDDGSIKRAINKARKQQKSINKDNGIER